MKKLFAWITAVLCSVTVSAQTTTCKAEKEKTCIERKRDSICAHRAQQKDSIRIAKMQADSIARARYVKDSIRAQRMAEVEARKKARTKKK